MCGDGRLKYKPQPAFLSPPILSFFDFSGPFCIPLSPDEMISTNKVLEFFCCFLFFLSAAANACNCVKGKEEADTLILHGACMLARACVRVEKGRVIKENIPQGGSIVVIQTCMGPSVGCTDTVLRVCRLY